MDNTPTVIAWLILAVAIVGGLLAILRYVNGEIAQERTWREEADDLQGKEMKEMSREVANFKLEATQTFAPHGAIEKLETRLVTAIEKLGARQETMLGRMETLSAELAKRRAT